MTHAAVAGPLDRALPWLVPALLVTLWQVSSSLGWLPPNILPAPSAVLTVAWTKTLDGTLASNLAVSFVRAFTGLLIGGAIGFGLGLLNGLSRTGEKLLDPTLQMIRNIPHLALIPLVIIWFGIEESARLFLVALGVFFPIYLNTLHGVRNVDPQLIEMGRIYGMDQKTLFTKVVLPGALPSIFVGLRFALGVMWLTLIVAETIAANSGIGHMAMAAREFMQTDIVVLSIVIYALLGKLADSATRWLEQRFLSWNPAYAKR
jgi:sulfonate transport system permease protein